jgi:hypothetical protein
LGRVLAENPDSGYVIPTGSKAVLFSLSKGQEIPKGVDCFDAVDIVCEIPGPYSLAIMNVKLLAIDGKPLGENVLQCVVVELTKPQYDVLILMQKNGTKLGLRRTR